MTPAPSLKILHVITDLKMGGAEMVLYRLLASQDREEFPSGVVSLTAGGPIGERISALGIPVWSLGVQSGFPHPRLVTGLRRLIKEQHPQLIQTWMYHADLTGGLAAWLSGNMPVVWGLHHTVPERSALKPTTYLVARLNAWLSHFLPTRIVCCAEATRRTHLRLRYVATKMVVLPNGIDTSVFRPDPMARQDVLTELNLDESTPLVGLCARFDAQKDHENFLKAAGLLHAERPDVHFVLWGQGVDLENARLQEWARTAGVEPNTHLLGFRSDSPRLMAALDVASLSSSSEAFPLVVGEAMACGIPCAVTDVGDAAMIVGETGRVVPPRNPDALSNAWAEILSLPLDKRRSLGLKARQRIVNHYSLARMASAYNQLYREIIKGSDVG
jgi:glycosyltransferase involved in cell wall biosynthesis